jgi:hypothetical protein
MGLAQSEASDKACKPLPRRGLSAFGNLFVDLPESDSRHSANEAQTSNRVQHVGGCSMLATFREADALQATMPAVGLLRFATTQNGRFGARLSQVTTDRLRPARYRSVTELTLGAVDVRIVGVQNRDHVRPSIETRSGKATRRDLHARRWRS